MDCDETLGKSSPPAAPVPCPKCGSIRRPTITSVTLSATAQIHDKIKWRSGNRKKRPLREGVVGDDLHQASGRWSTIERTIDRVRDFYYEHVVDKETGRIIRHAEERLT